MQAMIQMQRITVIGAGAWGTALAQMLCQAGRDVVLWAREPEVAAAIDAEHVNRLYLPDVTLNPALQASSDPAEAGAAELVLLVAPAQHLRSVCGQFASVLKPGTPAVICAKGIELDSHALMSEVAAEALGNRPIAVLSGPTFAIEVARGLPTAVTLACADENLGARIVEAVGQPHFRPYAATDVIGSEIGGALKNVIAIACGIVMGKRLGDNARAALMTRGLAEMRRYGALRGARAETLMGLSGLGDLALTCNSPQSRNMSLGIALGEGKSMDEIMAGRRSVAEGVATAAAVTSHAQALGIDMPIAAAVAAVCHEGADLDETIHGLLNRPFRAETA